METIVIQSNMDNLNVVENFLWEVCNEYHISNYYATISVPVMQAVRNAVQHGNKNNQEKKVTVVFDNCENGIKFVVKDEGDGFNFNDYGGFPESENQGTGIYLIKTLADKAEYSEGGRVLSMQFDINGIDQDVELERISTLDNFFVAQSVAV